MKQLEVQIMGQPYMLTCPEASEPMLLQAAKRVDAVMCRIRDSGKGKVRDRIAILAALNLAFELAQSNSGVTPDALETYPLESLDSPAAAPDALLSTLLLRLDHALAMTQPPSFQHSQGAPLA